MTHKADRVLGVTELARVEGEGALYIRASGNAGRRGGEIGLRTLGGGVGVADHLAVTAQQERAELAVAAQRGAAPHVPLQGNADVRGRDTAVDQRFLLITVQ